MKLLIFIYSNLLFSFVFAQTWQKIEGAPTHSIRHNDIYFLNDSLGWIVNGSGYVFYTKDSGLSWDTLFFKEYSHFRGVCFVSEKRGFLANIGTEVVAGGLDTIPMYETFDGGLSWQELKVKGQKVKGICNFFRLDDSTVFATGRMGGGGFFVRSDDKGENWTAYDFSKQIGLAIDCYFVSKEEGFIFGGTDSIVRQSTPAIWHTKDGGKSWQKIFDQVQTINATCWKVYFPTPNVGYVSILDHKNPATFLKTIDAGKTWQSYSLSKEPFAAKGLFFMDECCGWIGGDEKKSPLYTADGGLHWQPIEDLGFSINRFRKIGMKLIAIGKNVYTYYH